MCVVVDAVPLLSRRRKGSRGHKEGHQGLRCTGFLHVEPHSKPQPGQVPPAQGSIAPGAYCPNDVERARYVEFLSDGNAVRRNNLLLYLSTFHSMTFMKTLTLHTAAAASSRFRSLPTHTTPVSSASPVGQSTLSPSAQVVED